MDEFQNNYAEYKKPESLHPTKRILYDFIYRKLQKIQTNLKYQKKKINDEEKMQEGGITES